MTEPEHKKPLLLLTSPRSASSSATSARARSTRCRSAFHGTTASPPTPANVLGVLSLVFWSLIARRHRQVPHVHPARRQPRRGRHPRAARARAAPQRAQPPRRRSCSSCSASSARRCSTATASSRRPSRCSAPWRASRSRRPRFEPSSSRSPSCILVLLFAVQRRGTGALGASSGRSCSLWFVVIARRSACVDIVRAPERPRGGQPAPRRRASSCDNGYARLPGARLGRPRASPAARRSTPTWATSAAADPRSRGSRSCCPRCCSTTSARARSCSSDPERASSNPFYRLAPALGAATRWSCSRRWRRSSPRRRSSRARSRSPSRRCSSASSRACTIVHTSAHEHGQIYVPAINWVLAAAMHRARARLPHLDAPGRGVRHRRHRHDGDHDHPRSTSWRASAGAGR